MSTIDNYYLSQSSLFYGGKTSDKKRRALEVAGQLLGVSDLTLETVHPDFFAVMPTPPKSQADKVQSSDEVQSNWTIKIEQIHELKSRIKHFPLQAACQVIFIDDAEMMTVSAANSLLKVLEEPRVNQIFILTSNSLHRILPTIRSRCAKFYFATPDFGNEMTPALNVDFTALEKIQNDFVSLSRFIKNLIVSEVDMKVFLQALRRHYLKKDAVDTGFFDKITQAEIQLGRHLQKEFVLENLFL